MSKSKYERESQAAMILGAMIRGRRLTCLDILSDFGCMNGKGRIHELRRAGKPIEDEWVELPSGKICKRYFIPSQPRLIK